MAEFNRRKKKICQLCAGKTVDYYTDRPAAKAENALPEPELRTLKVDKKGRAKVTLQPMGGVILK